MFKVASLQNLNRIVPKPDSHDPKEEKRKSRQGFRLSLVVQINALTGKKPLILEPLKNSGIFYRIHQAS
jgi:hypothetical protein